MDPIIDLSTIRNSFQTVESEFNPNNYSSTKGFSFQEKQILYYDLQTSNSFPADTGIVEKKYINPNKNLVDVDLYHYLTDLKKNINNDIKNKYQLLIDPFEKIGSSIFMTRDGVKLANIDMVMNITGHTGGYLSQQTNKDYIFCDLGGAPGAFTQYLQFRLPRAYGYGISLKDDYE